MTGLNLLIKPSSSLCNIACTYCFYLDEAEHRSVPSHGIMKDDTIELLVQRAFQHTKQFVNFMFQGGEPTIVGLEFFERFHELVKQYNTNNIPVSFSLQTNGILITEEWAIFLKKHDYLIGISLDGTKTLHDRHRGDGTFDKVMKGINSLRMQDVLFNVLTVVTDELALKGKEVLEFFNSQGLEYLQFIPCLDSLGRSKKTFLDVDNYTQFLHDTFSVYKERLLTDNYVSIRYFDNLVGFFLGRPYESCDMQGICSLNTVIEADGSVYPCDFYVLDDYRLGNVHDNAFTEILESPVGFSFCKSSHQMPQQCKTCLYMQICRAGGCRRNRIENSPRFCKAYLSFFGQHIDDFKQLANHIIQNNQNR